MKCHFNSRAKLSSLRPDYTVGQISESTALIWTVFHKIAPIVIRASTRPSPPLSVAGAEKCSGAKRRRVCLLSAQSYRPVITLRVCEALAFQNRAALENEGARPALITIPPRCSFISFASLSVNIDGPRKVRRAAGGKKKNPTN